MNSKDLVFSRGRLRYRSQYVAATCGWGGVTDNKREGDGATPRGAHSIVGLYYRPDRMSCPSPWAKPILPGDLWCDDPQHKAYNSFCRAPIVASSEALRRSDPQYDLIIITDWNWPQAVPGLGSAIFMHQWRRPGAPTAGCIAMARRHLVWLATSLMPETRLIVR